MTQMLVLASTSPRRAMLLSEWGYKFATLAASVSEEIPAGMHPEEGVRYLAEIKAQAGLKYWLEAGRDPGCVFIGADTMVVLNGGALGKPDNPEQAAEMLARLSGKTHSVLTGVAILTNGKSESATVETGVCFRNLSSEEIKAYVATGEPLDKAGAYGIQGEAGKFVQSVNGSLTNVIGLPMEFLSERLKAWGM